MATDKEVADVDGPSEFLSSSQLSSLRTLLKADKAKAKDVLLGLRDDAMRVKETIETEMVRHHGFQWPIWMGFHAVPSMEHLHLHVISADLVSASLKNKKHYNSFHPKLGFFLHIEDVLSWFETDDSAFGQQSKLQVKDYEPLLKEDLVCFHCEGSFKTIPKLKEHLQHEWDKERPTKEDTTNNSYPTILTIKRKYDRTGLDMDSTSDSDTETCNPSHKRRQGPVLTHEATESSKDS